MGGVPGAEHCSAPAGRENIFFNLNPATRGGSFDSIILTCRIRVSETLEPQRFRVARVVMMEELGTLLLENRQPCPRGLGRA